MQIEVKSADPRTVATAALVVGVLEESTRQPPWTVAINRALGGAVAERIAAGDLRGKLGEVAVVAGKSRALKAEKVVAVGLGKPALLLGLLAQVLEERGQRAGPLEGPARIVASRLSRLRSRRPCPSPPRSRWRG